MNKSRIIQDMIFELECQLKSTDDQDERDALEMEISNLYYDLCD